jgi:hypothetical protein
MGIIGQERVFAVPAVRERCLGPDPGTILLFRWHERRIGCRVSKSVVTFTSTHIRPRLQYIEIVWPGVMNW